MRTPKGPKGGRGASAKTEVNKLRKKAMKNKMMKKTMLALDDTKVSEYFHRKRERERGQWAH